MKDLTRNELEIVFNENSKLRGVLTNYHLETKNKLWQKDIGDETFKVIGYANIGGFSNCKLVKSYLGHLRFIFTDSELDELSEIRDINGKGRLSDSDWLIVDGLLNLCHNAKNRSRAEYLHYDDDILQNLFIDSYFNEFIRNNPTYYIDDDYILHQIVDNSFE